jgi:hypothetical protein
MALCSLVTVKVLCYIVNVLIYFSSNQLPASIVCLKAAGYTVLSSESCLKIEE